MKQAQIKCPHCGTQITVRQTADGVGGGISTDNQSKIFAAADRMFKAMDKHFNEIFDPKLWRDK